MADGILQNSRLTINKLSGDMNFVGLFFIIIGALECLTIVGAIVGIPLIICGLRLRESSNSFNNFLSTNNEAALDNALEKQSRFFFIQKILIIISIVLFVVYFVFLIVFGLSFLHSFSQSYPRSI